MDYLYDVSDMVFSGVFSKISRDWNSLKFPTGGLYFFFNKFFADFKKIKESDNIIAVFDSPPYLKKQLYPDYKGNRKKDDISIELFKLQVEFLKECLYDIGVPILMKESYEADDLIYSYVNENKDKGVTVRAKDRDLADIGKLSPRATLIETNQNEVVYPDNFILSHVYGGDLSDNYDGIPKHLRSLFESMYERCNDIQFGNIPSKRQLKEVFKLSEEDAEAFYKTLFLATPRLTEIGEVGKMNINLEKLSFYLNALALKKFLKSNLKEEPNYNRKEVRDIFLRLTKRIPDNVREYFDQVSVKTGKKQLKKEVDIVSYLQSDNDINSLLNW